jgi:hypothetical protein
MKNTFLVILALVGSFALLGGCASGETTATKEQEEAFRNPSKEPPAGMAEGMEKAAEAGRASGQAETR